MDGVGPVTWSVVVLLTVERVVVTVVELVEVEVMVVVVLT